MIDVLVEQIQAKQNPTVVGLDPQLSFLPSQLKEQAYQEFGKTPEAVAKAFFEFNKAIIDQVYDLVPAVKPQIAMYELYGAAGIAAYIETIAYAKAKGLVVIGDIKRSDIASTAAAYAQGHIGVVPIEDSLHEIYQEDFITLNPFLGIDSMEPFLEICRQRPKGLFLLVKTSNPNSGQLQDLIVKSAGATDSLLYQYVGQLVSDWGQDLIGQSGFSKVGAVVGATHRQQAVELRKQLPHTFFLVPGYGAQGGTAEDIRGMFDKEGRGVIVNSSRGIINAYHNPKYRDFGAADFAAASRQAVIDMRQDLNR